MPEVIPIDDTRVEVRFVWSTEQGPCYDCGLPAAFIADYYARKDRPPRPDDWEALCAVCAANAAANGHNVRRIDEMREAP